MRNALRHLSSEIRSATTSMTSVPKPLKFLRPHYGQLKKCEFLFLLLPDCLPTCMPAFRVESSRVGRF